MNLTNKEIMLKMFLKFKEYDEDIDEYFSIQEQKLIFLINDIVGLTTYDDSISLELGKDLLDVINIINQRQTFEYIKDESNYKKYIINVNYIKTWLDWGCSIRGAWFSYYNSKIHFSESFDNIGLDGDSIDIDELFMNWFIKFLNNDEVE